VNEPPPKPTVDEAKAAHEHSPAFRNTVRVLRVLASVSKKLDSASEGTPFTIPLKVINGIVEVVEARHTDCSSYISYSSRNFVQDVVDVNESADTSLLDYQQRLETIVQALEQTRHRQSKERIETLAKCV
jgi:hypothetical protein